MHPSAPRPQAATPTPPGECDRAAALLSRGAAVGSARCDGDAPLGRGLCGAVGHLRGRVRGVPRVLRARTALATGAPPPAPHPSPVPDPRRPPHPQPRHRASSPRPTQNPLNRHQARSLRLAPPPRPSASLAQAHPRPAQVRVPPAPCALWWRRSTPALVGALLCEGRGGLNRLCAAFVLATSSSAGGVSALLLYAQRYLHWEVGKSSNPNPNPHPHPHPHPHPNPNANPNPNPNPDPNPQLHSTPLGGGQDRPLCRALRRHDGHHDPVQHPHPAAAPRPLRRPPAAARPLDGARRLPRPAPPPPR